MPHAHDGLIRNDVFVCPPYPAGSQKLGIGFEGLIPGWAKMFENPSVSRRFFVGCLQQTDSFSEPTENIQQSRRCLFANLGVFLFIF